MNNFIGNGSQKVYRFFLPKIVNFSFLLNKYNCDNFHFCLYEC
ncbi:unnamed protein product [Brugia timori]|uniref:Uncharacterized protein n=1 Tax=Brugia timori TaxID=42155 RepID=A0A0R3R6E8_9BILA|nr:unnamed protein product [Brugia timori]